MIGGIVILIVAIPASLFGYYAGMYHHIDALITLEKCKKYLMVVLFIALIPIIIQEKLSGHFSTWFGSIFINTWEMLCGYFGLYFSNFLMDSGILPQFIIEKPCKDR